MVNIMEKLIVGLPKGSLQEATYTLLKKQVLILAVAVAPIFHS